MAGSVVTVVFLDLAFLAERWLRHAGQLVPNKGRFDKACAIGSIFFSIAGALGLILLSCFDTLRHPNKHEGFLAMFLAGYIISAILICAEYLRLGLFYRSQHRVLFASFVMKLTFIIVEIALAIAFGVTGKHKNQRNASAVLEWGMSSLFLYCYSIANVGSHCFHFHRLRPLLRRRLAPLRPHPSSCPSRPQADCNDTDGVQHYKCPGK